MKLCFSSLGCCDRHLDEMISLAQGYGMQALEIRGIGGVMDNTAIEAFSEEELDNTARLLKDGGISAQVLGTSCSFHREENFSAAIAEGEASIRIAERLGIKYIRVFGDRIAEKYGDSTSRVVEGISRLCAVSDKVSVLLEVHGDFNTVEALAPVVEKLGEIENFGLIWDIQHTHKTYGASWREFYSFARPYIKHVHIKDYSDQEECLTLPGRGDVAACEIVSALLEDGYDGFFSLEWEKKWHPELPVIEEALELYVKMMNGEGEK